MKRPVFLIALTIIPAGLVLFGVGDTVISVTGTSIPNNEVAISEANNVSASGSIRIAMTGVLEA